MPETKKPKKKSLRAGEKLYRIDWDCEAPEAGGKLAVAEFVGIHTGLLSAMYRVKQGTQTISTPAGDWSRTELEAWQKYLAELEAVVPGVISSATEAIRRMDRCTDEYFRVLGAVKDLSQEKA